MDNEKSILEKITDTVKDIATLASDAASHAWVDVWLGAEIGWQSMDVTHKRPAVRTYCRLAVGRDYLDAAPVRGVRPFCVASACKFRRGRPCFWSVLLAAAKVRCYPSSAAC